jgi:hypothetical protein
MIVASQRYPHLDLILVEHPDGPSSRALEDSGHPLYHAGQLIRICRAKPSRFIDDLVITRPWTRVRVELIGAAAELAAGVPALTWRILDLAPSRGEDDPRPRASWLATSEGDNRQPDGPGRRARLPGANRSQLEPASRGSREGGCRFETWERRLLAATPGFQELGNYAGPDACEGPTTRSPTHLQSDLGVTLRRWSTVARQHQ